MPTQPRVWLAEAFEPGSKYPTARVVDRDGNVLVQGNFTGSIFQRVYDLGSSTPTTALLSNTVAIADVIFNTLQSWDIDDVGFNFRATVTSNQVTCVGGHTYRFSYLAPHTTQGYIPIVFDLKVQSILSL
jgi:hypothetical protein